jgi:ABC-type Fe3+ transport system permease subunit
LQLLRYILLPLASRGIAAGFVLAFLRGMGEFGITMMIAGNIPGRTQTISLAIWDAVMAGNDGLAATLAATLALVTLLLLVLYARLERKRGEGKRLVQFRPARTASSPAKEGGRRRPRRTTTAPKRPALPVRGEYPLGWEEQ